MEHTGLLAGPQRRRTAANAVRSRTEQPRRLRAVAHVVRAARLAGRAGAALQRFPAAVHHGAARCAQGRARLRLAADVRRRAAAGLTRRARSALKRPAAAIRHRAAARARGGAGLWLAWRWRRRPADVREAATSAGLSLRAAPALERLPAAVADGATLRAGRLARRGAAARLPADVRDAAAAARLSVGARAAIEDTAAAVEDRAAVLAERLARLRHACGRHDAALVRCGRAARLPARARAAREHAVAAVGDVPALRGERRAGLGGARGSGRSGRIARAARDSCRERRERDQLAPEVHVPSVRRPSAPPSTCFASSGYALAGMPSARGTRARTATAEYRETPAPLTPTLSPGRCPGTRGTGRLRRRLVRGLLLRGGEVPRGAGQVRPRPLGAHLRVPAPRGPRPPHLGVARARRRLLGRAPASWRRGRPRRADEDDAAHREGGARGADPAVRAPASRASARRPSP